ncbi:hypothetical protein [Georgenia sp. MJ170]|uniref:hypothetical protein n=1 Tax=Georgenia sunbinii TaxID=3117728 RepID=UPI002F269A69
MLFASWENVETIQLVIPEMVEERGSSIPDWSKPPAKLVDVPHCIVEPLSAEERTADREATQGSVEVRAPAVVDVPPFARLRRPGHPGRDYEVIGEPRIFRSATGSLDHTSLLGKRWEG